MFARCLVRPVFTVVVTGGVRESAGPGAEGTRAKGGSIAGPWGGTELFATGGTAGPGGACVGAGSTQLSHRNLAGTGIRRPLGTAPQVIPRVVLLAKGTPAARRSCVSRCFSLANFPPFETQPRTF